MELVPIGPTIVMLRFPVVQAYVVRLEQGFAVVDTGPLGSDDDILESLRRLGAPPNALRQIVLTHCHKDHAGSAAALVARTGAVVVAGDDAPVIAGLAAEPEPVLTADERPFYDDVVPTIPSAPSVAVDRVVREGDDLGWSEPTVVVHTPGHTPGGIAVSAAIAGVVHG